MGPADGLAVELLSRETIAPDQIATRPAVFWQAAATDRRPGGAYHPPVVAVLTVFVVVSLSLLITRIGTVAFALGAGYLGAPDGETRIRPRDRLVLYGREARICELDQRRGGSGGDRAHGEAVAEQERIEADEDRLERAEAAVAR